jgi:hypothetical protein
MSQSGHFRAHGRRDVDLSAVLDRGDAPEPGQRVRSSAVPARPIRQPFLDDGTSARSSETSRKAPNESFTRRTNDGDSAPSDGHADGRSSAADAKGTIRIVNLGLGGACIETAEPIEIGVSCALEIMAPTLWDPLVLRGRVVWTRKNEKGAASRAGLSFVHDDPARTLALFELLGAHDYDV